MEKKKRPKAALRGGKGTLTDKMQVDSPTCRVHATAMKYDPLIMGWKCSEAGCNYRRYKKSEIDQYGPPLVCEGPFTLVVYQDPASPNTVRPILRGSNNVAVDLNDILTGITAETDPGSVYNATHYELTLRLNNVTVVNAAAQT